MTDYGAKNKDSKKDVIAIAVTSFFFSIYRGPFITGNISRDND